MFPHDQATHSHQVTVSAIFTRYFRGSFVAALQLLASCWCLLAVALGVVCTWGVAWLVAQRWSWEVANWHLFSSSWYLVLLGVGILHGAAALVFAPVGSLPRLGRAGAYSGWLLWCAGEIWSCQSRVQGELTLQPGELTHEVILHDEGLITAAWVGRPTEFTAAFTFRPGPADWAADQSVNCGAVAGIQARILGHVTRPRPEHHWEPDAESTSGPAVKLRILAPDASRVADEWLADDRVGDALILGPLKVRLSRSPAAAMTADFLTPPTTGLGEKGLLAVYHGDQVWHVAVDEYLGKSVPLPPTLPAVEIAAYLPNAVPDRLGKFQSRGDHPKNPMLELRVRKPGEQATRRQIALAKEPGLNLDGVYGASGPLHFRYFHPVAQPAPAVELLQSPDGKLHARVPTEGAWQTFSGLAPGQKVTLPGKFAFTLLEHLPSARHRASFVSAESETASDMRESPAALVEITVREQAQQVWLWRDNPVYGQHVLETSAGPLLLSYQPARQPLGFHVTIPPAADKSAVPATSGKAGTAGAPRPVALVPGQGTQLNGWTFAATDTVEKGHGQVAHRWTAARDPGWTVRVWGAGMLACGLTGWFFRKKRQAPCQEVGLRQNEQHALGFGLGSGAGRDPVCDSHPDKSRREPGHLGRVA